jgi:hypothetical protein
MRAVKEQLARVDSVEALRREKSSVVPSCSKIPEESEGELVLQLQ